MKKNYDGKDPWADKRRADPNYYYAMMKQLTLLGYFTSEIGCKQAKTICRDTRAIMTVIFPTKKVTKPSLKKQILNR